MISFSSDNELQASRRDRLLGAFMITDFIALSLDESLFLAIGLCKITHPYAFFEIDVQFIHRRQRNYLTFASVFFYIANQPLPRIH